MVRFNNRGMLLLLAGIVIVAVAGIVTSLLLIAATGSRRENLMNSRINSMEIAEAALQLSLTDLRKATDGQDNDDDGMTDEGIDYHTRLLDPAVVPVIEGRLGRVGTEFWNPGLDVNGNGYPNFDEPGVTPMPLGGGDMIAWSIFSEGDGADNDGDGEIDEGDEAGFVTIVALGRFRGIVSQIRYSGRFSEVFAPPNSPDWIPDAALICGGNLTITGNAVIGGSCGDVHSNLFLAVTGNCSISGDATASSGLSVSGAASVSGVTRGDVPLAGIPHIDPPSLEDQADYILCADGRVLDASRGVIHDAHASGAFNGWSPQSGGWHFSGNGLNPDALRGTYYVEGDASIAGTGLGATVGKTGGGDTQAVCMSVIAEGDIQMAGNTRLQHHHPDGLLFIAGGDIRLTGTPQLDQRLQGIIAAHEQVFIAGTPAVFGTVVAEDGGNSGGLNVENRIPGTPDITYEGGLNTHLPALDPRNPRFILEPKALTYEEK